MTNINNIEKNYVVTSVFVTIFITFLSTFLIINNMNDVFASNFAGQKSQSGQKINPITPPDSNFAGDKPRPPVTPQSETITSPQLYLLNDVMESLKNNDKNKALTYLKFLKQELSTPTYLRPPSNSNSNTFVGDNLEFIPNRID
jgi:hypothetical protein